MTYHFTSTLLLLVAATYMIGHENSSGNSLLNKTCTTHKLSYTCRHIRWRKQIWIDQFHLSDPLYKAACIPLHDETGKTHNRFLSLIIHHLISHNNSIFYNCLIEDVNISSSKTSAPNRIVHCPEPTPWTKQWRHDSHPIHIIIHYSRNPTQ